MNFLSQSKRLIGISLLVCWLWFSVSPAIALADEISPSLNSSEVTSADSEYDWVRVNQSLVVGMTNAYRNTEAFVTRELDWWAQKRIEKIDSPFLDWYFNFFRQKRTEFGVPFAWLAHKMDSKFKFLQTKEEKAANLTANQIIKQRMAAEIQQTFQDMVIDEKAQADLGDIATRAAQNYTTAISLEFAKVKGRHQIPDQDWNKHLESLAKGVSDTGIQEPGDLAGRLATKVLIATAASASTKLVLSMVAKSTTKLIAKVGGAVVAKWGASLVDPAMGLAIIAWDVWSYQDGVAHDRPQMRADLISHITELRNSFQENVKGDGIMDAIAEIQNDLLQKFQASV